MNATLTPYSATQETAIAKCGSRASKHDLSAVMTLGAKGARSDGRSRYVFATAYGYVVDRSAPPFGLAHYEMTPTGFRRIDCRIKV